MKDEIWVSRSGKQTPVAELDVEHLRNILRMILRKRRQLDTLDDKMREELAKTVYDTADDHN